MKKSLKTMVTVAIIILIVLQLSINVSAALKVPAATSDFYVNDFAEVFTQDEVNRLMDNAVALSKGEEGIQVVITTVKSLEGHTVDTYAVEMYNEYGIGKDGMGVLILFSLEDRKIKGEIGEAMETYITDTIIGNIIGDYAIPYLKENKFADGLINLQEAIIKEINVAVEEETPLVKSQSAETAKRDNNSLAVIGTISLVVLFFGSIIFIIVSLMKEKKKSKQQIKEMEEEHNSRIGNLSQKYERLLRDCKNNFQSERNRAELLNQKKNELELELSALQDRYRRVNLLYPSADKEVSNMIQEEIRQENIKKAKVVEEAIKSVILMAPSMGNISTFSRVINKYSRLTEEQKGYVEANVEEVKELLSKSEQLKLEYEETQYREEASVAMERVEGKIRGISKGNANNLNQLEDAMEVHSRLRVRAKKYFDESLLKKVKRLFNEAKADKERLEREEEERRRRQRMQSTINNHSSYNGHSSFRNGSNSGGHSGFGGRSRGGGASRSF